MISLVLTDDSGSLTLPILEVPLTEKILENSTDVQTLDFNIYTDFINQKREWVHTWDNLTETQYEALRGYYDRQFTTFKYPTLSIDYYSIVNIPVRMTINKKDIYNNCGSIQKVSITLRETSQLPEVS